MVAVTGSLQHAIDGYRKGGKQAKGEARMLKANIKSFYSLHLQLERYHLFVMKKGYFDNTSLLFLFMK